MRTFTKGPGGLVARAALVLGVVTMTAGCGQRTGHIAGKVLQKDGKPLPGGTVTFFPEAGGGTAMPVAAIVKADGTYDAPAVPVGPVKITVSNATLDPKAATAPFTRPPAKGAGNLPKYIGPPKDALKDKELPDPGRPPAEGTYVRIDSRYAHADRSGLRYEVTRGNQTHDIQLE
jgi:hypothetical protein